MSSSFGYIERVSDEKGVYNMLKVVSGTPDYPIIKRFDFPEWLEEWKEDAEKWNKAIKEGLVFGDKEWVLDSIYELKQENKQLKKENNQFRDILESIRKLIEINENTMFYFDVDKLKQILATKEEDC